MEQKHRVSVVIPSYRRTADLTRCLTGMFTQTRPFDEVIVVARDDDHATRALVEAEIRARGDRLQIALVTEPGVVAALNVGVAKATGDILCFTDDDANPFDDWLANLLPYYADADVGGVGGRDMIVRGEIVDRDPLTPLVGKVTAAGKIIGNHHRGTGGARDVDVLKGVNMSFRAALVKFVGFDVTLRGTGAQVHNELGVCLAIKRLGYRLVFDDRIRTRHFPAVRHDEDQRSNPSLLAKSNAAYNLVKILLDDSDDGRRRKILAFYRFIGTYEVPGLVQVLRGMLKGDSLVRLRYKAVQQGIRDAAAFHDKTQNDVTQHAHYFSGQEQKPL